MTAQAKEQAQLPAASSVRAAQPAVFIELLNGLGDFHLYQVPEDATTQLLDPLK